LDDVTPLRQIDSHVAAADTWLFRPQAAIRMRPGSDQGTPVPMDEPLAPNPPEGAVLDYYLKTRLIARPTGKFSTLKESWCGDSRANDELHKTNSNDVQFQVEWLRDPKPLLAEAGMHRFVWDLRYALPKGVRSSFWGPAGPLAVPGNYTVNSRQRQEQHATADDQVGSARENAPGCARAAVWPGFQARSKIGRSLDGVATGGDLRKQIDTRKKEADGNTELLTALQGLEKKVERRLSLRATPASCCWDSLLGKEIELFPKLRRRSPAS